MPEEIPFDSTTTPLELSSSLLELETALSPILSRDWSEQLEVLSPLERAKMDVMMAYTIVDLIWVYLKMKGVDPSTHEVLPELERVRDYYTKIRNIEEPDIETRKHKLDIPAAGRFITAGIPRNQRLVAPNTPETSAAGAAAASRRKVLQEQEEASLERLGKSGRMRFIQQEAERVVPGSQVVEGMGVEDIDIGQSEEGDEEVNDVSVDDEEGVSADLGLDNESDGEDFEMLPEDSEPDFELVDGPGNGGIVKSKRKRAEEF